MKFIFILTLFCTFLFTKSFNAETTYFDHCASCHGDKGTKMPSTKTKKISSLRPETIRRKLIAYKKGKKHSALSRAMKNRVRDLSIDDIEHLAVYISKLN